MFYAVFGHESVNQKAQNTRIISVNISVRRYQQIIQYHIRQQDLKSVLSCCRRHGQQDPSLWVQALWFCARDPRTPSKVLEEILQVIGTFESCHLE